METTWETGVGTYSPIFIYCSVTVVVVTANFARGFYELKESESSSLRAQATTRADVYVLWSNNEVKSHLLKVQYIGVTLACTAIMRWPWQTDSRPLRTETLAG